MLADRAPAEPRSHLPHQTHVHPPPTGGTDTNSSQGSLLPWEAAPPEVTEGQEREQGEARAAALPGKYRPASHTAPHLPRVQDSRPSSDRPLDNSFRGKSNTLQKTKWRLAQQTPPPCPPPHCRAQSRTAPEPAAAAGTNRVCALRTQTG